MNKRLSDKQYQCYILINQKYPGDEPFTSKMLGVHGNTLSSLANAGFVTKINDKSPFQYINSHKQYVKPEKTSKKANGYTEHNRGNNQYFAQYMEQAIDSIINHTDISNKTDFTFTEKDIELMNRHAQLWAQQAFSSYKESQYVGRSVNNADCDIIFDNQDHVELKYVSSGTGTYFNPSLTYFEHYGFDFHKYMEDSGYLAMLQQYFPNFTKIENKSPFSESDSSYLRKKSTPEEHQIYTDIILPFDAKVRKQFTHDLFVYFSNPENSAQLEQFARHIITKNDDLAKNYNPDYISIFAYQTERIYRINPLDYFVPGQKIILTQSKGRKEGQEAEFSLILNNKIRVQIGWQNGTGLNNPTFRVFLE